MGFAGERGSRRSKLNSLVAVQAVMEEVTSTKNLLREVRNNWAHYLVILLFRKAPEWVRELKIVNLKAALLLSHNNMKARQSISRPPYRIRCFKRRRDNYKESAAAAFLHSWSTEWILAVFRPFRSFLSCQLLWQRATRVVLVAGNAHQSSSFCCRQDHLFLIPD